MLHQPCRAGVLSDADHQSCRVLLRGVCLALWPDLRKRFFPGEDMMEILREASDITSYGIRAYIDQVREKSGDSPKLLIAEKWLENMKREE